jgi:hypothetical protein
LIGQEHAGKRPGDVLAKIDYPDSVEYTSHTFPPPRAERRSRCPDRDLISALHTHTRGDVHGTIRPDFFHFSYDGPPSIALSATGSMAVTPGVRF